MHFFVRHPVGNYNLAIGNKINDWDLKLKWGLGFEILIRDWRLRIGIGDWGLGLRIGDGDQGRDWGS